MANVNIKNADGAEKYLKSSGVGSDGDPHIPEHLETNSAAIKTAVQLLDNAISGSRMLVTEDNSAAIKTAVELLDNAISGAEMQVDVITMPTVTETNSADIKTAVEILDNAISGSEMQVDVVTLPSLAAGSAAIGKLATNSGVDIGDVTLNAGSASIGTLGANSGVDIGDVTLNAGSATVGKLAANSGVDIGDVDVTSLPALPAGTNNIGDVDVLSLPALAAGSATIGKLAANSGVDIGDVTLTAGAASIGTLGANSGVDIGDVTLTAGAASIGTLGANSGVDIGDVTLNAGTAEVGKVTSLLATDSLRNGTTSVTPAFVAINAASSGDNTLLAAAGASNKIRVLAMNIVVGAAVNVRVESGAGGTAMTGIYEFNGKGDGLVLPFSPVGWFETAANTLLNLELSDAVSADGSFVYVVVQ